MNIDNYLKKVRPELYILHENLIDSFRGQLTLKQNNTANDFMSNLKKIAPMRQQAEAAGDTQAIEFLNKVESVSKNNLANLKNDPTTSPEIKREISKVPITQTSKGDSPMMGDKPVPSQMWANTGKAAVGAAVTYILYKAWKKYKQRKEEAKLKAQQAETQNKEQVFNDLSSKAANDAAAEVQSAQGQAQTPQDAVALNRAAASFRTQAIQQSAAATKTTPTSYAAQSSPGALTLKNDEDNDGLPDTF